MLLIGFRNTDAVISYSYNAVVVVYFGVEFNKCILTRIFYRVSYKIKNSIF